jgi:hypothetical protein
VVSVRHLVARADPRLDLRHVLVLGFSASGQLALQLAGESAPGAADVTVSGAIALAGVLDLRTAAEANLECGAVAAPLGGRPPRCPIATLPHRPSRSHALPVRQVIIHGSADRPHPGGDERHRRRCRADPGDSVDLQIVDGASHFDPIDPSSTAWPVVACAVRDLIARGGRLDRQGGDGDARRSSRTRRHSLHVGSYLAGSPRGHGADSEALGTRSERAEASARDGMSASGRRRRAQSAEPAPSGRNTAATGSEDGTPSAVVNAKAETATRDARPGPGAIHSASAATSPEPRAGTVPTASHWVRVRHARRLAPGTG